MHQVRLPRYPPRPGQLIVSEQRARFCSECGECRRVSDTDFSTTGYSFCPDESDCVTTCLAQSSSSTTLDSCTADCQDMCGDYLPVGWLTNGCNGQPVYQLGDVR